MDYEAPVVEMVGPANELVQNYMGPSIDGDGYALSLGWTRSTIEEE